MLYVLKVIYKAKAIFLSKLYSNPFWNLVKNKMQIIASFENKEQGAGRH